MKYIGILLDNKICRGIPSGKTSYENISFYEEGAKLYGLTPCFFRLKDLKPEKNKVTAYLKDSSSKYVKASIPIPSVIHNRGLYFSKKHKQYVQSLVEKGLILYNQWNRYRKLDVHHKLIKYDELTENLPETHKATKDNIVYMLSKYPKIIIKPDSGSLGIGVMKIERQNNHNLLNVLNERISSNNYIVQEYIPLATYKGNPFDMRVSCQKNYLGEWQVTGIVGKVAKDGSFITNVARGGTVYPIEELLQDGVFEEEKTIDRIKHVSLKISKILEEHYPGLADIGLDMGITGKGTPKFIECNGRDLRYSFRNANMYETWKSTYITPIGYGKFLIDR